MSKQPVERRLGSILFAHFVATTDSSQVVAVEANAGSVSVAARNVAHLNTTVSLMHGALVSEVVATESSFVTLMSEEGQFWSSHLADIATPCREGGKMSQQQVPAVTLRQLQVRSTCCLQLMQTASTWCCH
jgi:hypothetical protein